MPKLSSVETDPEVEQEGRWVTHRDGFEFCIARMENPRFVAARHLALQPYRERLRAGGELTSDETDEITRPLLARHILTGWRKVEDDDGQPIPYSFENAMKLFCNPALQDVAAWIVGESGIGEAYRCEALARSATAAAEERRAA